MRPGLPRPRYVRPAGQSLYAMLGVRRTAPPAAPHPRTSSISRIEPRRMVANQDRDRLCRRCAALHIMVGKREHRICFRVISADRAGRDTMGLYPEAADHAALV